MSDLYLIPTSSGGDITITDGQPQMTSGIETAVYLSLFTQGYWGNSVSQEQYDSEMDALFAKPLSNQTRLAVIDEAKRLLAWMIADGLAAEIEVSAGIPAVGVLHLAITIHEPDKTTETFAYALNWNAQEASLI